MLRMFVSVIFSLIMLLEGGLFAKSKDDTVKIFDKEIESLLKAELLTDADSAAKGGLYMQLGDILSSKYCFSQSLDYYKKAVSAFMHGEDVKGLCRSLTAKAKSEFLLEQYDNSIGSYKQALTIAGRMKDTNSTIGILNCLSAVMLYSANKNDGAEIPEEQITALCANASAFNKELGGDMPDFSFAASDEFIKDSLTKAGEEFIADFNLLKDKLVSAALLERKMAKREGFIIAVCVLIVLMIVIPSLYFYKRIRIRESCLTKSNSEAKETVAILNGILERKISGFKRFLDSSAVQRERPDEFLKAFKRYINIENGRVPDAFGDIIDIANYYYNGIINRLRLSYPTLNDEELYMCALITLDFPISSIKFIYNHASDDSMYNKRARLKKKLGLGADERPEKFIKELVLQPIVIC